MLNAVVVAVYDYSSESTRDNFITDNTLLVEDLKKRQTSIAVLHLQLVACGLSLNTQ